MTTRGAICMVATNPAEAKVMRAIIAREHKKAQAERSAALANPEPASKSNVGWSTKPGPKRGPNRIERDLAAGIVRPGHRSCLVVRPEEFIQTSVDPHPLGVDLPEITLSVN